MRKRTVKKRWAPFRLVPLYVGDDCTMLRLRIRPTKQTLGQMRYRLNREMKRIEKATK
jgi:hypothetical protein